MGYSKWVIQSKHFGKSSNYQTPFVFTIIYFFFQFWSIHYISNNNKSNIWKAKFHCIHMKHIRIHFDINHEQWHFNTQMVKYALCSVFIHILIQLHITKKRKVSSTSQVKPEMTFRIGKHGFHTYFKFVAEFRPVHRSHIPLSMVSPNLIVSGVLMASDSCDCQVLMDPFIDLSYESAYQCNGHLSIAVVINGKLTCWQY